MKSPESGKDDGLFGTPAQSAVPAANQAEVNSQLTTILHYTSRQALQQALDQRSDGRLRLDPPTPG